MMVRAHRGTLALGGSAIIKTDHTSAAAAAAATNDVEPLN